MSLYDSVQLFCEGSKGSEDAILLEQARDALERRGHPLAPRVEVVPVGNKDGLKAYLRTFLEHLNTPVPIVRAFAIRDRDFLTRAEVTERRAKAARSEEAWPLSRHSIESYLADPDYLARVLGVDASSIATELEALASAQFWSDVVTACRDDLAYRAREPRPKHQGASSRDLAVQALRDILEAFSARLSGALAVSVEERVDHFAADFQDGEPLWARVHGKDLLGALKSRLQARKLPIKRLNRDELAQWDPPSALVSDLEALLDAINVESSPSTGMTG